MNGHAAAIIVRLGERQLLSPGASVVEIGAQDLGLGEDRRCMRRFVETFRGPAALDDRALESLGREGASRALYEAAEFSYACIDTTGAYGALELDFNFDRVPRKHCAKYGLVTNFGCTEHIANQLNAFHAIHDLCAVAGIMIHAVPMQGFADHGFVNYNPKFFWRLAEFNDYEPLDMHITAKGVPRTLPEEWADAFSSYDRNAEYQDTTLWTVFRKVSSDRFQAPFDGGIRSSRIAKKYRAELVDKYNALFEI